MRSFQRPNTLDPVPGDIVKTLRHIDRAAGAEGRYGDQLPQLLDALRAQARIESITASSAIEGVVVEEARITGLVSAHAQRFRNRSEAEFAGYRAALDYLNQHDPGEFNIGLVLHLHRLLFSFADRRGGSLKTDDNLVVDRTPDGTTTVRFEPVSALETPFFMHKEQQSEASSWIGSVLVGRRSQGSGRRLALNLRHRRGMMIESDQIVRVAMPTDRASP